MQLNAVFILVILHQFLAFLGITFQQPARIQHR